VSRSRETHSRIAVATPWLALSLLAALLVPSGSARAPSAAKRDETLRVAIYVDPGTIEPGTIEGDQSGQLISATQLTLVTYREDGGPGTGKRIIPYGAHMPTLSDDGKRYTFRIRSGLRFSDGSPVTGRSFQAGFERMLDRRIGGLWGWQYENVVGAHAFIQGQADDVSGVTATKDRLIFQLAEAEPDFLSRLALPYVSAMPLGLPVSPGGVGAPLPSAGPYHVEEFVPGRMLRLVRNRYWKPSTLLSRPAKFKEIHYLEWATAEAAVAAVRRGEADVATVLDTRDLNPDLIRELMRDYGVNHRQFWVAEKDQALQPGLQHSATALRPRQAPPRRQLRARPQAVAQDAGSARWTGDRPAPASGQRGVSGLDALPGSPGPPEGQAARRRSAPGERRTRHPDRGLDCTGPRGRERDQVEPGPDRA
jgi:ABC-type transport system substrate-binding protein